MAETVKCGVPKCGRRFQAGRGGRGGEKPRCDMHLARERRGSDKADVATPLVSGDKSAPIRAWVSPDTKKAAEEIATGAGKSLSAWTGELIERAVARGQKSAAAAGGAR